MKEGLALGLELSGFILASYFGYQPLAQYLQYDENIVLGGLMSLSLILWTLHAYLYFESKQ